MIGFELGSYGIGSARAGICVYATVLVQICYSEIPFWPAFVFPKAGFPTSTEHSLKPVCLKAPA